MFLRSFLKNDFGKTRYAGWEWGHHAQCLLCLALAGHNASATAYSYRYTRPNGSGKKAMVLPICSISDWIGQPGTETIIQIIFLILLVIYAIGKWPLFISGGLGW